MTYTALLIQFNSFEKDVARFEAMAGAMFRAVNLDVATKQPPQGFVDLLYSIAAHSRPVKHATGEVKHTNKSADRILRAYACAAPTFDRRLASPRRVPARAGGVEPRAALPAVGRRLARAAALGAGHDGHGERRGGCDAGALQQRRDAPRAGGGRLLGRDGR